VKGPGRASGALVCVRRNDRLAGRAEVVAGYRALVRGAERELLLMGSYFLPGRSVRGWLRDAVRRGVEVHVVLTGHIDVWLSKHAERYLYGRLLGMGVRLHEYLPTVLHAKCAVADGRVSTVGSFNVNHLSAYASIEMNVDVHDDRFGAALASEMRRVITGECREVTKLDMSRTGWMTRLGQWLAYRTVRLLFSVVTWRYRSLPT
jgi:cardiolipin synthase